MRVIAGDLGGRRIQSPKGSTVRPTSDRVREAIFNTLFSMGVLEGARVMDLFAGTGALGIEALSRGAAHCTFVDRDRGAVALIEANVAALGIEDRATVVRADALAHVDRSGPVDVVLADPPYQFDGFTELGAAVDADLLVVEAGAPVDLGAGWRMAKERTYGTTVVAYARRVTKV
jgi:16S rRNA (guanine966-N2)-methyltransferase